MPQTYKPVGPVRPITDNEMVSKAQVERALSDPALGPLVEQALEARGLTVEEIFPSSQFSIWSKSYTESKRGEFRDPVSKEILAAIEHDDLSLTDVSLLHKARARPDELEGPETPVGGW